MNRLRAALVVAALAWTAPGAPVAAQDAAASNPGAATPEAPATQAPAALSPDARVGADSATERQVQEIAGQLRCPVCQGLSLAASQSELAMQMKSLIRDQLQAGKTPEEVRAYFVSKYGEWILLEPPAHGFNLAVYLLPAAVLLLGLVFVVFMVRRWTAAGTAPEQEPESPDPKHVPDLH